jgi:hypothetical protein
MKRICPCPVCCDLLPLRDAPICGLKKYLLARSKREREREERALSQPSRLPVRLPQARKIPERKKRRRKKCLSPFLRSAAAKCRYRGLSTRAGYPFVASSSHPCRLLVTDPSTRDTTAKRHGQKAASVTVRHMLHLAIPTGGEQKLPGCPSGDERSGFWPSTPSDS